jgi:hypothetical protein
VAPSSESERVHLPPRLPVGGAREYHTPASHPPVDSHVDVEALMPHPPVDKHLHVQAPALHPPISIDIEEEAPAPLQALHLHSDFDMHEVDPSFRNSQEGRGC